MNGHTLVGLHRRLAAQAYDITLPALTALVADLKRHGLVFEESHRFASLAVPGDPVKLERP